MANRLANETSPYLLQHADNPVDWQPWDEAALQEARRRDAPVLLSIGYAACHWCHVMEHESFSDPATAEVMNSGFVCIKVDREERPDLDAIYMDAVQAMTGSGGWPMTVFLTPDGSPFYGGTYFPPEDRHGLPGFPKLLGAIRDAWTQRRGEVEAQAGKLTGAINVAARMKPSPEPIERHMLERAATALQTSFDDAHGGFGGAPKFPQPMVIDLLLRLAAGGTRGTLDMATKTLDAMASGGMFDQLGGGFHRYSVDDTWTVPHFEKMLYDNALLLRTYTRSHLVTDSARHLEVAEMTAAWMLDEMRDPGGAFYSSLDADSEGEEGLFYVWELDEVADVTEADFEAAVETWGFTSHGNFEGMNIPVAASQHTGEAARRARDRLLERRSERVRPATDDKLLAAWNGLAAASLAEAGAALDKPEWVAAAGEVMDFVLTQMRVGDRLVRAVRRRGDGSYSTGSPAFCEDYAGVLEACLALFEATGETRWIDESRWAADEALRLFSDPAAGGFFSTGSDAEELVSRPKDIVDNAVPSANSILALELQRLALVTSQNRYEDAAGGCLALVRDAMERSPFGFAHALCAADLYTSRPLEIVVIGPGADDLLRAIRARFMPTKVLVPGIEGHDAPRLPLLEARTRIDGRPTAYVCTRGACRQPATTVEDLMSEIEAV